MDREGRTAGGTLARGLNQGLVRNSPLIVAGIGAALAAGAPLITGAAAALFGGVGAAAAAQHVEVRAAWTQLGHDLIDGAVEDSAVLVPIFEQMAGDIGQAFQDLRPQLREAFADSAPLIQTFTAGVIDLAHNAMPGLVNAVGAAGPVFDGLRSFLGDVGTGLSDFFDIIAEHAPAAGSAFAAIGDALGELLPILGELLGEGAELASTVLPPLASALGVVADVLGVIGPILPVVATGFVALKVAQTAGGWFEKLSGGLSSAATGLQKYGWQGELAAIGVNKLSRGAQAVSNSMPVLAAAVTIASTVMQNATEQGQEWAVALREGGEAAATARAQMSDFGSAFAETNSGLSGFGNALGGLGGQFSATVLAIDEAKEANQEYLDSLTPQERAAHAAKVAEADLAFAIQEHGASSDEAKAAQERYSGAMANASFYADQLSSSISGVTSSMVAQAQQALAAADSEYAYRLATESVSDGVRAVADATAQFGATSEQASDAQLALEGSIRQAADAAAQMASDSLPANASELERNEAASAAYLQELYRLRDQMGSAFPAALQNTIASMERTAGSFNNTAAVTSQLTSDMTDLGLSVQAVPNQKFVKVDAPTAEQRQRLIDLGYVVTNLPNGDIYVSANTSDANAALDYAARTRYATIIAQVTGGYSSISGQRVAGLAGGGPVVGPGTGTSDSVPINASNGEHMVTAREVQAAGGHGAILQLRKAILARRNYADGGPIGSAGSTVGTTALARSTSIVVTAQTSDERRIARAVVNEMRDREFLASR